MDALHKVAVKAINVLTAMAIPIELSDRESLINSASNSLNKLISRWCHNTHSMLAPLAVDVVLSVVDSAKPDIVDLRDAKIVKN